MLDFGGLATQIKSEFHFDTCFFCDRMGSELVLSQDDTATSFFSFLVGRLHEKDDAYFSEVRFFRYKNTELKTTEHLALIPISLSNASYAFLGIIYRKIEYFDKLLKTRVLPAYLTHWLHNLITESEASQQREGQVQRLVLALEEKRQYTFTLENKLEDLNKRMQDIQASKGGKDVELFALRELLESQVVEYQELVKEYQSLFEEFEKLEKEYLSACVSFETKVHLESKLRNEDWTKEMERVLKENQELKQEVLTSRALLKQYKSKYNQILRSFSNWSSDMLLDFQKKVRMMGRRKKNTSK